MRFDYLFDIKKSDFNHDDYETRRFRVLAQQMGGIVLLKI
jgi:hypothetical protein